MVKKLLVLFMVNTRQTSFSIEKVITKVINCIFNGNIKTIHLMFELMLIWCFIKISWHLPNKYRCFIKNVKIELDISSKQQNPM